MRARIAGLVVMVVAAGMSLGARSAMAATPMPVGFSPLTTLDTGGDSWGTQIADVSGDGRDDLIVTNHGGSYGSSGYAVLVYAQQAGGGLATTPAVYEPSSPPVGNEFWLYPATGDLNGDGKLDLAVGHEGGLDVFLQAGGVLTGPTNYSSADTVYGIQIADLNADGRQDVVYAPWSDALGEFRYLRRFQLVGGTLGGAVEIGTGTARRFQVGDITGDGRPDVVLEDESLNTLRTFVHDAGAQTFTPVDDDRFSQVGSVGIADVTGDGRTDLVGTSWGAAWLATGQAGGTLGPPLDIITNLAYVNAVEIADLNGDAKNDVTVFSGTGVRVALQDAGGGLAFDCSFPTVVDSPYGAEETVAVGDLDGDGSDEVIGAEQSGGVRMLTGVASGSKTPTQLTLGLPGGSAYIGDELQLFAQLTLETGVCMPAQVKVWRRNPDLTSAVIGTVAPQDMGDGLTWVAGPTDTPPTLGTYGYKVTWPGDGFHTAASSEWLDLEVVKRSAYLDLVASPSGVWVGGSTTLQASLEGPSGPQDVSFFRRDPAGDVLLATLPAAPATPARLTITPAETATYYALWAGDDGWAEATSADVVIPVSKRTSSVSLTSSPLYLRYGDRSTLTATLKGGDGTRKISFYKISGTTRSLLKTVTADGKGRASMTVSPGKNTAYVATFDGDDRWKGATSDRTWVKVRVLVDAAMTKASYVDHGTAVYPCCRAHYRFGVKPNHGGKPVRVQIWAYVGGHWAKLGAGKVRLDPNSTQEIYFDIANGGGYRFRVQACMEDDVDHIGNCSAFDFFRFTGTRSARARRSPALTWRVGA